MSSPSRRSMLAGVAGVAGVAALGACSSGETASSGGGATTAAAGGGSASGLGVSAIPDQDPALLNRLYPLVSAKLSSATGLTVTYRPVTDYTAVVRAFEIGDIYLSWMGGLTGVQARHRVAGAQAIAQRDIDADFHSLFIANAASGLAPFDTVDGLKSLASHTLTFGSETSTSGRLMPEYFLLKSGLQLTQLAGKPGFSGSHDATIQAVSTGSFQSGAVNEQVWKSSVSAGKVDPKKVVVLWRTPGYQDYHWLARPDLDQTFGAGMTEKIKQTLLALNPATDADILKLFGAAKFVTTQNSNYDQIESVANDLGLLT